jgi:SAM-dependent methyltransferase
MKTTALNVFVCPSCHGRLLLDVAHAENGETLEGRLDCTRCRKVYPITRGVPRFVPTGAYAESFGRQWHWFRTVQLDSATRSAMSDEALRDTTGWDPGDYAGRLLLDAGVGAGRYAERAAAKGAQVYGVDLTVAVDAAYQNIGHLPNVHLAQADIFALPFRDQTFDLAYSIGVLHHTPDPSAAFRHVAATVAPGGKCAAYLYSRYGPQHRFSDAIRTITTRLPLRVAWGVAAAAVPLYFLHRLPVVGGLFRTVLPISMEPNWRWRWLDTFDWYTPKYQFKYLYPEVFGWFRDNGFDVTHLAEGPIRVSGRKTVPDAREDERRTSNQHLVAS